MASNPVSDAYTSFANSADAYNVDALIKTFTIGRVRVSTRQMLSSGIGIDTKYVQSVLVPSILDSPRMDEYPCIGFPDLMASFPPNLDPQTLSDLPLSCSLHVIDGNQRVEALKSIEMTSQLSVYWIFIVVHPAIFSTQLYPYLLLQQRRVNNERNYWKRHPVGILNLATSAAHDLYGRNRPDLIPIVIDSLIRPDEVFSSSFKGEKALVGIMPDLVSEILSSPHIVTALFQSKLLEQPFWHEAKEHVVVFLHALKKYNVSHTAVKIIHCAADTCQRLTRELHRPFVVSDVLPPNEGRNILAYVDKDKLVGIYRSAGLPNGMSLQNFWNCISELSRQHNLPPLMGEIRSPLDGYLRQLKEVLKIAVFLRLGYGPLPELMAPSVMTLFPVSLNSDAWTVLTMHFSNFGAREGLDKLGKISDFLTPRRIEILCESWKQAVLGEDGEGPLPEGDLNFGVIDPFERYSLSLRVSRLPFVSRDWFKFGERLSLLQGQKLACSQDGYPAILFSAVRETRRADPLPDPPVQPPASIASINRRTQVWASDIVAIDMLRHNGIPSNALATIVTAYLELPRDLQEALGNLTASEMLYSALWAVSPTTKGPSAIASKGDNGFPTWGTFPEK
ncbi:hypothetical protein NLJ89_g4108 [Agrocybe chaxingu]|uniref:Uncharacterized protein n=1 Tax=Agrocybe chaxingu TaxID=84603 RepID=A0A9W8K3H2_9AGAR|nr:hypothetical protein NLJ89_g4108 [Agrocybe chaxingu]